MMRMRSPFVHIAIFILISSSSIAILGEVRGDGGFIPRSPSIKVFESGQNAIIAFNGGVERLILSVNIRAENETEGFHIIPFPSMPRISLGNISIFNNLSTYYEDYILDQWHTLSGGDSDGETGGSISILLAQKLGEHQITVIKVNNPYSFKTQLNEIAEYLGISIEAWPDGLDEVIWDYTLRGIPYFTIDRYPLFTDNRTTDPIVFDFNTDKVFFPLKISSLFAGKGNIGINIFTPDDLPLETGYRTLESDFEEFNFMFSKEEVGAIDPCLSEIVPGDALLTRLQTWVDLGSLKGDIEIGIEDHVVSANIDGPYHWEREQMSISEDRMISYEGSYMKMYSLPDLTLLWSRQIGGYPLQLKPFFVDTESGGVPIVLVGSGNSVRVFRLDPGNGNDTWWADFDENGIDLDLEVIDHPLSQYLAVIGTGLHLFDLNTGYEIPIPPHEEFLRYTIVRKGLGGLMVHKEIDGTSGIYTPFNITYFDPLIHAIRRNVRGELPGLWCDGLYEAVKDYETVTGMQMNLESVLQLNNFIFLSNKSDDTEQALFRTFFDQDMGILELRTDPVKGWIVRCLNESSRTVEWETKVHGFNKNRYVYNAFFDLDSDGSNEMILIEHPRDLNEDYEYIYGPHISGSVVVIDGSGRKIFERTGFDASLPIKRSKGSSYIAGMTENGFCCFNIDHKMILYNYSIDQSMHDINYLLISEWNEIEANVSFITTEGWTTGYGHGGYNPGQGYLYPIYEYKYSIYRTDRSAEVFEKIATIVGKYLDYYDMSSTVGIVFDRGKRLYTFQYDDNNVRSNYPRIMIPERNLGIDGLRSFLNGSGTEVHSPLITPFIDPAPIMIMIILMALIIGRGRDRVCSKRT